jgi:hypothetical protein
MSFLKTHVPENILLSPFCSIGHQTFLSGKQLHSGQSVAQPGGEDWHSGFIPRGESI